MRMLSARVHGHVLYRLLRLASLFFLDEPLLVAMTGVESTRLQGKIKDAWDLYECATRWEIAILPSLNV